MIEPDWDQTRPDAVAIRSMWYNLRIEPLSLHDPALEDLLRSLRETHVNGGAVFASFAMAEHPVLHWFASRNRLDEIEFPEQFFRLPAVSAVLPELCNGLEGSFGFKWGSAFTLAGELAATLAQGGAYRKHEGGAADAYAMAERFRAWLFGDRFDEVHVLVSREAWSDWFYAMAWDSTWLILDKRQSVVSVLAVTDVD